MVQAGLDDPKVQSQVETALPDLNSSGGALSNGQRQDTQQKSKPGNSGVTAPSPAKKPETNIELSPREIQLALPLALVLGDLPPKLQSEIANHLAQPGTLHKLFSPEQIKKIHDALPKESQEVIKLASELDADKDSSISGKEIRDYLVKNYGTDVPFLETIIKNQLGLFEKYVADRTVTMMKEQGKSNEDIRAAQDLLKSMKNGKLDILEGVLVSTFLHQELQKLEDQNVPSDERFQKLFERLRDQKYVEKGVYNVLHDLDLMDTTEEMFDKFIINSELFSGLAFSFLSQKGHSKFSPAEQERVRSVCVQALKDSAQAQDDSFASSASQAKNSGS